ncbi:unnamed protein product [Albugo candida]|uniref:Uncharacterized protein n=1 Tax=Albugo candida TaxID=65357 RepID=A0A024FTV1_9STRA|nr:unnamed protein product [Albugo candida]|eukprot:CCI10563.1 unnamed protein product [Albugo candida]
MTMQSTIVPGLRASIAPEVVAKTDKSVTLHASKPADTDENLNGYSDHKHVYYLWTASQLFNSLIYVAKGLLSNTDTFGGHEEGSMQRMVSIDPEKEDVKRSGTSFEHGRFQDNSSMHNSNDF